jgi:hypothetical protein
MSVVHVVEDFSCALLTMKGRLYRMFPMVKGLMARFEMVMDTVLRMGRNIE